MFAEWGGEETHFSHTPTSHGKQQQNTHCLTLCICGVSSTLQGKYASLINPCDTRIQYTI